MLAFLPALAGKLFGKAQQWALTALAVIAVLVGAYAWGGRNARKAAELKQQADRAAGAEKVARELRAAVEERNALEHSINQLPAGESLKRLRERWSRKD